MKINKALDILESWMPKEISEDFDNVGLLIGDPSKELRNILVTLDILVVRELKQLNKYMIKILQLLLKKL